MMASIRLFGRGKNAAEAGGGTALRAEQIAQVLAQLSTASMSTTWRCRHGSGSAIGEGAVDFEARRSRATVIRGKSAFEYVRVGSSVYRAPILDDEVQAQLGGGKKTAAAGSGGSVAPVSAPVDEDADDEEFDEDAEIEAEAQLEVDGEIDEESEADADEQGGEDGAAALDQAAADVDGVEDPEAASDDEGLDAQERKDEQDGPARAWQSFSEHDACGVHAYAEPAVLAAGVRAAGVVGAGRREEFDGRVLTGYAVTLKPKPADPDRLLARLARQLRDHGANTLVVTAFVDDAQDAPAKVPDFSGTEAESAAGGEGAARIVRLRLELAHWTPADDPTADHSVTVDLFEFGDPVQVQVPTAGVSRRTTRSCADLALF